MCVTMGQGVVSCACMTVGYGTVRSGHRAV